MPLQEAIVAARPVPNMPQFFNAMRAGLPGAHHLILSARDRSMRPETLVWLDRHGLWVEDAAICFVPRVDAKLRIWRQLSRNARLVIVDDLSYNHEAVQQSVYEHLVEQAEQIAFFYIGLNRIAEIASGATGAEATVSEVVEALAA
jgi:hypothetical protein